MLLSTFNAELCPPSLPEISLPRLMLKLRPSKACVWTWHKDQ